MAWVRNLGVMVLTMAVVAGLGGGCGESEPEEPLVASDELRAQIVEAVSPVGMIFHAKMKFVSADESSPTEVVEVWIDGANKRARRENRVHGEPIVEVFADARSWSYDPQDNRVDTHQWASPEQLAEMPVQSPGVFALPYVRELLTGDEWRILDEKSEGGRHFLVETKRVQRTADEDHAAGTVFMMTVELDKKTLLPVRERHRVIQPDGEERGIGTVEFQRTEYLSPDEVPPDLFSPESLNELVEPR